MKLNLNRLIIFLSINLFAASLAFSSDSSCLPSTKYSNQQFKLYVESTFSSDQAKDAFLLDEAICKKPESVFQYEFKSNTKGLIKVQAVCNVINLYAHNNSKAHDEIFGKIKMEVDPMMSLLLSMISNTSLQVLTPTKASPGILGTDFGDDSSYEFLHRDDEAHKQKHLSKLEAEDSHCHIAHKKIKQIGEEDIKKVADALYRTGVITLEEKSDLLDKFSDF